MVDLAGPKPWPDNGSRLPYQIIRKPEKSNATPFELPNGAVIDLNNSGFGLTDLSLARGQPPAWVASTPYVRGTYCRPSPSNANGFCYVAVVGGTSGPAEPAWPAKLGAWVVDGTGPTPVRWQCVPPVPVTVVLGPSGRMSGVTGLDPANEQHAHRDVAPADRRLGERRGLELGQSFQPVGFHRSPHGAHHDGGECGLAAFVERVHCVHGWHVLSADHAQRFVLHRDRRLESPEHRSRSWPSCREQRSRTAASFGSADRQSPWAASTGYLRGTYCRPITPNGFCYVAVVAGISGGSQPGWPTKLGATVVDGTA